VVVVDLGVQMRKKRKVSRVMGWLLSFQLSDPGAGVCWADSMACGVVWRGVLERWCWVSRGFWLRCEGTRLGESAVGGALGRRGTSPHMIGYMELWRPEAFRPAILQLQLRFLCSFKYTLTLHSVEEGPGRARWRRRLYAGRACTVQNPPLDLPGCLRVACA
jgi:hypothetical protein